MKKKIFNLGILLTALSLTITGCDSGNDDNNSSKPEEKHVWAATELSVSESETGKASISTYYKVILPGSYTKTAFEIKGDDTYYFSETAAEMEGEKKYKDVSSETSLTVNGAAVEDGKSFTVELGMKYKIVFSYKKLTKEVELLGASEGSFIEGYASTIAGIENELIPELPYLYVIKTTSSSYSGTSLTRETVRDTDLTSDKITAFRGPDASNLTKVEGELKDYVLKSDDKVLYIYNQPDLTSTTAATTVPCEIPLNVSPLSAVKNLKFKFNSSVTENNEIGLLEVLGSSKKIICYANDKVVLGEIALKNTSGEIRDGLKFELFTTKDLSGEPVATITSSTTESEKWTPGKGTEITKWVTSKTYVVGDETIIKHSDPYTENNYFVKITYTYAAGSSITSSNIFKIDSDKNEYPYILNFIKVNLAE